jgi:hypothetical protein
VNAPIRSQQYQQHPQIPINEEVLLLDVEMNPPSLIEGSGADMNPGVSLGAQVVHEKGHRIEALAVFHNGDSARITWEERQLPRAWGREWRNWSQPARNRSDPLGEAFYVDHKTRPCVVGRPAKVRNEPIRLDCV